MAKRKATTSSKKTTTERNTLMSPSDNPISVANQPTELNLETKRNSQITGNVGMFYVSFRLSLLGYNVIPTSRNTKGIDLIVHNENATKMVGIQVKCLSRKSDVPLGKHKDLSHLIGEVWCIVVKNTTLVPDVYVLTLDEVKAGTHMAKDSSNWLGYKYFAKQEFHNRWSIITDRLNS